VDSFSDTLTLYFVCGQTKHQHQNFSRLKSIADKKNKRKNFSEGEKMLVAS
jgi:hypothetical protein